MSRIQRARELAGLSQAQLAKLLKVDQDWVFQLESGGVEPTDAEFATLAELFCVSVDWLRDNTSYQHTKWQESIVKVLRNLM